MERYLEYLNYKKKTVELLKNYLLNNSAKKIYSKYYDIYNNILMSLRQYILFLVRKSSESSNRKAGASTTEKR